MKTGDLLFEKNGDVGVITLNRPAMLNALSNDMMMEALVIAAVNGAAAGAGVGIALAADFILAAQSMKLHLTFSKIGMGLDAGTSWFLARQLGQRRAAAISGEENYGQKATSWKR